MNELKGSLFVLKVRGSCQTSITEDQKVLGVIHQFGVCIDLAVTLPFLYTVHPVNKACTATCPILVV